MNKTRIVPPAEKSLSEMNADDRKAISLLLQWQGKSLKDCSHGELIQCIIHMTAQVVSLKSKLDKVEIRADGSQVIVPDAVIMPEDVYSHTDERQGVGT